MFYYSKKLSIYYAVYRDDDGKDKMMTTVIRMTR